VETNEYIKQRFDSIETALKENTAELVSLRTEVEGSKVAARLMKWVSGILVSMVVYIYFTNNSTIDKWNQQQDGKISDVQQQVVAIQNKMLERGIR